MSKCWAAVILEWAEEWVGIDLVTGPGQKTAGVIAANVVAVRGNGAAVIKDVNAGGACFQNGIPKVERAGYIKTAAFALDNAVTADRAVVDGAAATDTAAAVLATVIAADRAIGNGNVAPDTSTR
jgi:hypothetical protein